MIKQYVKKPVPIKAIQWTGKNKEEIEKFCDDAIFNIYEGTWDKGPGTIIDLYINTIEGRMHAKEGDYIIRGPFGEFYPCEEKIFEATYSEC